MKRFRRAFRIILTVSTAMLALMLLMGGASANDGPSTGDPPEANTPVPAIKPGESSSEMPSQPLNIDALLGTDVRMSNAGFNTAQTSFQIDINPTDSRYAVAVGNDGLTAGVAIYRTSDGGQNWSAVDAPLGAAACCSGDVAYAYDGSVYVSVLDTSPYQVYIIRSLDNGLTWGTPTIAPASSPTMDRPSIVVDNGISSPRRGRVYLTYSFGGDGKQIGGYYSTNQGATWNPTGVIGGAAPAAGYQQASNPYVAPDGTLYVGYQEYENTSLGCASPVRNWLARSDNGGTSFTQVLIGGAPIAQGGACSAAQAGRGIFCVNSGGSYFRSRSQPIVSGDPFDANIVYVVYSGGDMELPYACAGANGYHSDTLFTKSTDRGATWSEKIKINGDPPGKDQYFPWMDVAPDGTLWTGWLDRRADVNNYQHVWWQAYSNDNGDTWQEFPVADSSSLPTTNIGDYSGLSADTGSVLGMWWDSRIKAAGDPYTDPISPPQTCRSELGGWVERSPLSLAVFGAAATSDGIRIYVGGGRSTSGQTDEFWSYNPEIGSWKALPNMPTAVDSSLAVFAEGKVYLFGGNDSSGYPTNLVQVFDIATSTWSTPTSLPDVRQQMGGGYHNGKIYLSGGYSTASTDSAQNQTWEFTLAGNSWANMANLPAALAGPGSGIINGHLYILGGRDAGGLSLYTNYDYDIAANTWTMRASLPQAVNAPGSVVYAGRIWVMGGGVPFLASADPSLASENVAAPESIDSVAYTQIFDPAHNAWQSGPGQNVARSFQTAAVVNNQIVSMGGYGAGGNMNTVEVATQPPLRILVMAADMHSAEAHLQRTLLMLKSVGQVDVLDGIDWTPSLATLRLYDLVVPFSNSAWNDPTLLGNVLADYEDAGGVVVASVFDWFGGTTGIGGRWQSGGYSPFNSPATSRFSDGTLGSYTMGHPLMAGVKSLAAFYRLNVSLAPGAIQVASWDDGVPLIAYKGRAVGISAYIGEVPLRSSGDFARVIANAGNWLRNSNPPCCSLTCKGPTVIEGSISSIDRVQNARLFRASPPSSCAAPKTCPGISGSGLIHYDVYSFSNNTPTPQCVTVGLDPKSCLGASALHSSAFLGNFNPANQCSGYLADIGASPGILSEYSFTVEGGKAYSIVVNETTAGAYCPSYSLTVSADSCPAVATPLELHLPAITRQ